MNTVADRYEQFRRSVEPELNRRLTWADATRASDPEPEPPARRTVAVAVPATDVVITGCYDRNGKTGHITELLLDGHGIRSVARQTGASTVTVAKIRRQVVQQRGEIYCGCGLPSTHPGWCRVRYSQSPARQQTLLQMRSGLRCVSAACSQGQPYANRITASAIPVFTGTVDPLP